MNSAVLDILNYFHKYSSSSIPYCIQTPSPNPGDHVVIVGGIHGNEPGGVRAIVQLHRALRNGEIALKRGKISFLLGNPKAYENAIRYVDNDLNRAFFKQDTGSVEGRRASEINAFLQDNDDISALLDLHSVSIGNFKILVYGTENPANTILAMRLSPIKLHFAFHSEHMPGTLIGAASRRNVKGLIVECGNHYSTRGAATALQHICSLLVHHHLIDEAYRTQAKTPATITRYESIQAIKPHPDFKFLIKDIKTGSRLKKGQKFAIDEQGHHIAPEDCYVVVPSRVALPTDVDAGFLGSQTMLERSDFFDNA